ncbi:F-box/FBD/LRR-repeat protein [Senna tora]|uniref:F-box/FBD/LRR-repeat protein n=1 Tax=Senna tora TaxID=362788 RepID=A0A834T4K8_9FABA|nr:F-box/FBD/LRR-repeat protein [Senna tora]
MASSDMTQHVSQKSRGSEDEDRISNLPESIIGYILSCLPIKDAVATSVLSKRWVYLWTYITTVCIDDWAFPYHNPKKGINNFENFVSSVLLGLNNSTIQNFSLNVARKLDPSLVNAWISAILKRRVTNFTISSPKNVTIISSHYLFSCNSLVQLILNISCSVRVLASVHLPNLQNLELYGVKFLGESSGISKDMILSFPVLKKFKAKMFWLNVQSVTLQVPLLEVVNIYCESLEYDNCTIKICASCVREFSYHGYLSQYYILSDPSFAPNASAYITIHNCHSIPITENELGLRASMLVRQLDQVKYLKLEDIRVFGIAKEAFVDLPTLEMVHHLKLGYVIADMLLALLLKTPNLITLDIMVGHLGHV